MTRFLRLSKYRCYAFFCMRTTVLLMFRRAVRKPYTPYTVVAQNSEYNKVRGSST